MGMHVEDDLKAEIAELEAINAELLEACRAALTHNQRGEYNHCETALRAAIEKAEGK